MIRQADNKLYITQLLRVILLLLILRVIWLFVLIFQSRLRETVK